MQSKAKSRRCASAASGENREVRPSLPQEAAWRLWFLISLAWIAALSLAPFEVSFAAEGLMDRLHSAFGLQDLGGAGGVLIHFLGFAAAGFLGFRSYQSWLETRKWWQVAVMFLAGCLLLESAKLFVPQRHALVFDLIVKGLGAWMGTGLAARWKPAAIPCARPRATPAAALLAVLTLAAWWHVGLKPLFGSVRLDWNPDFRLVIGNEADGSRPWKGAVREFACFDRALSPHEIRLAKGGGRWSDALVRYQLPQNSGEPVMPKGKLAAEPDLVMEATTGPAGSGNSIFATRGAARSLTEAIAGTGAFSVAATIVTGDLTQTGPARIISLSRNPSSRNFTLGQENDALEFRVANGANGPNGTKFPLHQKALAAGTRDIVVTYDHGYSSMHVDGVMLPITIDLREPYHYLPIDRSIAGRGAVLVMFVISFMVPACFALRRWMSGIGTTFSVLLSLYALGCLPFAMCSIAGGPWNPALPVSLLLAVFIITPLSFRYLGQATP